MTLRSLTTLLLSCWFAVSCVFGIPDYDHAIDPEPESEPGKPCTPIIVDGVVKACLDDRALREWVRRNIP